MLPARAKVLLGAAFACSLAPRRRSHGTQQRLRARAERNDRVRLAQVWRSPQPDDPQAASPAARAAAPRLARAKLAGPPHGAGESAGASRDPSTPDAVGGPIVRALAAPAVEPRWRQSARLCSAAQAPTAQRVAQRASAAVATRARPSRERTSEHRSAACAGCCGGRGRGQLTSRGGPGFPSVAAVRTFDP